jgi:hypothetical protein
MKFHASILPFCHIFVSGEDRQCGSIDGSVIFLQDRRSRIRVSMKLLEFFNLLNPFSSTTAPGFNQSLT